MLTSVEKWAKMKAILEKWWKQLAGADGPKLSHKELLLDRGFLVYVTRTYPAMVLYLKGFHLTIEMCKVDEMQRGGNCVVVMMRW